MNRTRTTIKLTFLLLCCFIFTKLEGQKNAFEEFNQLVFSYLLEAEKFYEIPPCSCNSKNEIRFYLLRSGLGIRKAGLPSLTAHNIVVLNEDGATVYAAYKEGKLRFRRKGKFISKFNDYKTSAQFLPGWNMDPNFYYYRI